MLPVLFEGEIKAVIELASFDQFDEIRLTFLDQLAESIGIVLNTIAANMRTEELLKQSPGADREPAGAAGGADRDQQAAGAADPLAAAVRGAAPEAAGRAAADQRGAGDKAQLLAGQKAEVEQKNKEVEQAKVALEEKAEQLALTSKYKSEFLANMSHELRTPLNSLLILSQILTRERRRQPHRQAGRLRPDDPQLGLGPAGPDQRHPRPLQDRVGHDGGGHQRGRRSPRCAKFVESTFRQMADLKGLDFEVELDPALPPALQTDTKRLQQVLKNLLSNAFKFTERGSVALKAHARDRAAGTPSRRSSTPPTRSSPSA